MPGFFRGSRIGGLAITPNPTYTGQTSTYQHGEYTCLKLLTSGTLSLDNIGPYDVFAVGGGGAGGYGSSTAGSWYSGGGGGGYTSNLFNFIPLNGKQSIAVTIGQGATERNTSSMIVRGGTTLFGEILNAEGGFSGQATSDDSFGGPGGSGGGTGGRRQEFGGGSDGSDGGGSSSPWGIGQHVTTRAFQDPTEQLYAGGGGGSGNSTSYYGGPGGAGGGGHGLPYSSGTAGSTGEPNTGGGGGGRVGGSSALAGGSGVVIIRWKAR